MRRCHLETQSGGHHFVRADEHHSGADIRTGELNLPIAPTRTIPANETPLAIE